MTRDVQKTKIRLGFSFFKTEPSKKWTSVQTVFRYKLHAIRHSNKKSVEVTVRCIKCADKERFKT